mmetsp:Transcript_85181/g.214819  ORF Transcript_85181/g.214819 Transcript_85181/m.214819 type:complete len:258 (+) Transcript_85181:126-899(+)|eukprot:CAMPEP_0115667026 /NCGR_PEP_ID=MMETSP0272-20121206/49720_1 /TAXON_ID=71861 /ORGANISM="Scrippsiella trochoidea, Strain CCMP3099" /LENGTH=257 /DNA_ID=CAMNT_0003105545 /DNA_START=36 /DNA_END=809 /DNA_ORIENTATION=+
MGGNLSVEECTSPDNPRVKDCCHLEGETPVEIRIAYQHPRPAAHPASASNSGNANHMAGAWDRAQASDGFYNPKHAPWPHGSMDAEKPPMPRGAERLRLPPPSGGARAQPRTPHSESAGGGDFDADTFAAPPDSERSDVAATPGRMQQPVALQVLQLPDDDYFPEIVRIGRHQGSNTFREASSTYRGDTHRGGSEAPTPPRSLAAETAAAEASLVAAALTAEAECQEAVLAPAFPEGLNTGEAPPLMQPPAPKGEAM